MPAVPASVTGTRGARQTLSAGENCCPRDACGVAAGAAVVVALTMEIAVALRSTHGSCCNLFRRRRLSGHRPLPYRDCLPTDGGWQMRNGRNSRILLDLGEQLFVDAVAGGLDQVGIVPLVRERFPNGVLDAARAPLRQNTDGSDRQLAVGVALFQAKFLVIPGQSFVAGEELRVQLLPLAGA